MTSGTVFANRKLSFKKIIMAIWEEITAAKGMAALHLTRKLNTQYKTAYVLLQKLREAVGLRRTAVTLQGLVQIDGKYVGGVLRKANKKEERKDGRKRENQNGKHAPNRTLTRVIMDENGTDAWAAVARHVDPKALLIADEHKAYDDLVGLVSMHRVNHSLQYQKDDFSGFAKLVEKLLIVDIDAEMLEAETYPSYLFNPDGALKKTRVSNEGKFVPL